jgi:hypothetical protein
MYKVDLININSGFNYGIGATFETIEKAQEWLNIVIGSEAALMPERQVPTGEIDENGNPIMQTLPAEFTAEIVDISAQVAQQEINKNAKAFLAESDYKIIRHLGQKALNIATSLSEEEYLELEQQRQQARSSIVEN